MNDIVKTSETTGTVTETHYMPITLLKQAILYYMGIDDGVVEITADGITVRVTREEQQARVG